MNSTLSAARKAGLAHLALVVSGILGFMVVRGRLVEPGDAEATAANLIANQGLARAGLAAMVSVGASQSLAASAAIWSRRTDAWRAGGDTPLARACGVDLAGCGSPPYQGSARLLVASR